MKNLMLLFIFLGLPFLMIAQTIDATASKVSFEISNLGFNTVEGTFTGMTGRIDFSPDDLSSAAFDVCVDAATVDTENEKRDEHLRKEDFFNVDEYPNICFASSAVRATKSGFVATGKLSLNGTTKDIELPFTYNNQQFSGKLEINRHDYKVGSSGSFLIGKTVTLDIQCVLK